MSDRHKTALAEGREQGRAVRRNLEALEQNRPKRRRKRTRESVERRLAVVERRLADAEPLGRLRLIQERIDLQEKLAGMGGDGVDLAALEDTFVEAAPAYGARRGITYSAWRPVGMSPAILRPAGLRCRRYEERPMPAAFGGTSVSESVRAPSAAGGVAPVFPTTPLAVSRVRVPGAPRPGRRRSARHRDQRLGGDVGADIAPESEREGPRLGR